MKFSPFTFKKISFEGPFESIDCIKSSSGVYVLIGANLTLSTVPHAGYTGAEWKFPEIHSAPYDILDCNFSQDLKSVLKEKDLSADYEKILIAVHYTLSKESQDLASQIRAHYKIES